jgi:hypothetical protein
LEKYFSGSGPLVSGPFLFSTGRNRYPVLLVPTRGSVTLVTALSTAATASPPLPVAPCPPYPPRTWAQQGRPLPFLLFMLSPRALLVAAALLCLSPCIVALGDDRRASNYPMPRPCAPRLRRTEHLLQPKLADDHDENRTGATPSSTEALTRATPSTTEALTGASSLGPSYRQGATMMTSTDTGAPRRPNQPCRRPPLWHIITVSPPPNHAAMDNRPLVSPSSSLYQIGALVGWACSSATPAHAAHRQPAGSGGQSPPVPLGEISPASVACGLKGLMGQAPPVDEA